MYPLGTASSRIEYANSFPSASKRGRSAKRYAQSRCADVSCVRKSLSFWYSETVSVSGRVVPALSLSTQVFVPATSTVSPPGWGFSVFAMLWPETAAS